MNYTLLMYETTEDFAKRNDPIHKEAYAASWAHYVTAMLDSGIVVNGQVSSPRRPRPRLASGAVNCWFRMARSPKPRNKLAV